MGQSFSVPVYLLHPMVVHFPIALLVLGFLAGLAGQASKAPAWLGAAVPASLVAGTLFLWAALGLGLVAEHYAPHVPPAWKAMADHKAHAWVTAWIFTALCGLQGFAPRLSRWWVLGGWAGGLLWLTLTAHLGAILVFNYGLGGLQP
jgi:uncharacterized membrane protein